MLKTRSVRPRFDILNYVDEKRGEFFDSIRFRSRRKLAKRRFAEYPVGIRFSSPYRDRVKYVHLRDDIRAKVSERVAIA